MKKRVYTLEYKDFAKRSLTRELPSYDIIDAMDKAKKFCQVNFISLAWVVSPTGKRYIV